MTWVIFWTLLKLWALAAVTIAAILVIAGLMQSDDPVEPWQKVRRDDRR